MTAFHGYVSIRNIYQANLNSVPIHENGALGCIVRRPLRWGKGMSSAQLDEIDTPQRGIIVCQRFRIGLLRALRSWKVC
jgi:hypothetical protein